MNGLAAMSPEPDRPSRPAASRVLGIGTPVIQAPMGGGPSTVELAAAVSNAGGLGSLAGGYLAAEQLRDEIRRLRTMTERAFAVNLFAPESVDVPDADIDAAIALLAPIRRELGLAPTLTVTSWAQPFDEQLAVVLEERPPVLSFTFGPLPGDAMRALDGAGIVTMGTATNVAEAVALVDAGCDLVCAQGAEAGGHHGSWLAPAEESLIGTMALVPLVCDAVAVPVVAAGGIMDHRGVAAALALGAGAAQMGTAFMLCPEARTAAPHRRAMASANETDIAVTTEVTGRLARGVRNALMNRLRGAAVPPYPVMNALTSELRKTAAARDDHDAMSLWCGQAVRLARPVPAADIVRTIADALGIDAATR